MKLSMMERMTLLEILPREGNFLTLKIVRVLRESLSPSEDEQEAIAMRTVENSVFWNATLEPADGFEIEIGEKATDLIVETLKGLDQGKKLTEKHLSIWEKFIPA